MVKKVWVRDNGYLGTLSKEVMGATIATMMEKSGHDLDLVGVDPAGYKESWS
jgi:hypothetical protein